MARDEVNDAAAFRPASSSDIEILVDFNAAMAKETENIDLVRHTLQAGVSAVLQDSAKGVYHVVEVNLRPKFQRRNCQLWWIQSVYVHPDHRRQGYFRKLYAYIRKEAAKAHAGGLRLYADTANTRAHSTYEALGMTSHYQVFEDMFS